MLEQFRSLLVGITLAVLAFLKPIDGELTSLLLVFFLNFVFGYLSGMIANREDFDLKKALRCGGEATVFFVLCCAIYTIGKVKGEHQGALQCVSFISYVVMVRPTRAGKTSATAVPVTDGCTRAGDCFNSPVKITI